MDQLIAKSHGELAIAVGQDQGEAGLAIGQANGVGVIQRPAGVFGHAPEVLKALESERHDQAFGRAELEQQEAQGASGLATGGHRGGQLDRQRRVGLARRGV